MKRMLLKMNGTLSFHALRRWAMTLEMPSLMRARTVEATIAESLMLSNALWRSSIGIVEVGGVATDKSSDDQG